MSVLTTIFQGVNPGPSRDAIATYVKDGQWETYVQPFAGRFGLCEVIARVTEKPENIWASDIGVYSSLLGYYLSDQSLRKLEFEVVEPDLKFLNDHIQGGGAVEVAACMVALKYAQLSGKKAYYYKAARKELTVNHDTYIEHMAEQFTELKDVLGGIHYRILDYKEEIKQHVDDESALIICDPPNYKLGYTRMFDPKQVYTWNAPEIPEFLPGEFKELMTVCKGAKATVLLMQYFSDEIFPDWHVAVSCSMPGRQLNKFWRILSNRPLEPKAMRRMPNAVDAKFQVFNDDEITKGSKVHILRISRDEANYYRDLLVHKLADAGGEVTYVLLIDGKIACVLAINVNFFTKRGFPFVFLNYAIIADNLKEPKQYKLVKELLFCRSAKEQLIAITPSIYNTLQFRELSCMRSTNITHVPYLMGEPKRAKIVKREKVGKKNPWHERLDPRMWRVVYEIPFNDKTFHQVVTEFLQKEGRL